MIMLDAFLADTINMTILEKSGHNLADEFIEMLLVLSLPPGGRYQIKYETLHMRWIIPG